TSGFAPVEDGVSSSPCVSLRRIGITAPLFTANWKPLVGWPPTTVAVTGFASHSHGSSKALPASCTHIAYVPAGRPLTRNAPLAPAPAPPLAAERRALKPVTYAPAPGKPFESESVPAMLPPVAGGVAVGIAVWPRSEPAAKRTATIRELPLARESPQRA